MNLAVREPFGSGLSATRGTVWAYAQNWAGRGITLVVFFALARLLSPADFGAFAVAMLFLTLGEVFVEQLFGHALVQRASLSAAHLDAAFWASLVCGGALALLALLAAPLLAKSFGSESIAPMLMALSPVFVLMALTAVPAGLLRRTLDYKTLTRRTAAANLISGAVAVAAAASGLGLWSFVLQQLCFHAVGVLVLWQHERWRPRWHFERAALRDLSGFSAQVTFIKLLDLAETRVIELVIGQRMGLAVLGYYALAARAQVAATQLLAAPLWDASISVFARVQAQREAVVEALQSRATLAATLIVPAFLFALAAAPLLVPAVFGQRWLETVAPFQVLCLLGALRAVVILYSGVLQATGAVADTVRVSVARSVFTFGALPFLLPYGPTGVAASLLTGQLLVMPVVLRAVRRSVGIGSRQVIRPLVKPVVAAVLAAGVGLVLTRFAQTRLEPALGALLSLAGSVSLYALLIVLLMPTRLLLHAAKLPGAAGKQLTAALQFAVRVNDSAKVAACMALMRGAVMFARQRERSGEIIVIVADTHTVIGSVGDQALIGGLTTLLQQAGISSARVLCRPGVAMPQEEGLKFTALPLWGSARQAGPLARELINARALVVVGADVLDGFYSRFESVLRLKVAGFAARRGVPTLLCSFSFNGQPDPAACAALKKLPSQAALLCRDEVSRERVARLVGERVELTADLGFLLEPSRSGVLEHTVAAWLRAGRGGSGPVFGWNLSPHATKLLSEEQRAQVIRASASVITRLVHEREARVVLVPHDFRPHASDGDLLADVFAQLPAELQQRVLLAQGPYSAADVKQCCVHFDLVLTCRMHLMIAALGRGVPVVAVEYQGKFAGALKHFGLGGDCLIRPSELCDAEGLHGLLCTRLDALSATRAQIESRRPHVEQLAATMLARLGPVNAVGGSA